MKTYLSVFLFFLCNAIGFSIGPVLYVLIIKYKIIDVNSSSFDAASLQYDMTLMLPVTWLICALFSFSVFFLSGIWRIIFLLAPIAIPFVYGISLIQTYP